MRTLFHYSFMYQKFEPFAHLCTRHLNKEFLIHKWAKSNKINSNQSNERNQRLALEAHTWCLSSQWTNASIIYWFGNLINKMSYRWIQKPFWSRFSSFWFIFCNIWFFCHFLYYQLNKTKRQFNKQNRFMKSYKWFITWLYNRW